MQPNTPPNSPIELSMPKKLWIPYLILLGITLGAGLCAGVFAAPVIFHADDLLGGGVLTHYQEGLIMTQIFLKMNWLVNIACVLISEWDFKIFVVALAILLGRYLYRKIV